MQLPGQIKPEAIPSGPRRIIWRDQFAHKARLYCPWLMPLVNLPAYLLFRFIKFTRLFFGPQFAHDLLKKFYRIQATSAFESFDMDFHTALSIYGNIKFPLGHK